jgi:hypothetical protein
MRPLKCLIPALLLLAAHRAWPDILPLEALKDTTLFEDPEGDLGNGAGPHLYAGRTNQGVGSAIRRALLSFDVAGSIPAGSTVYGATLTLRLSQRGQSAPRDDSVSLHRLLADWGEGASDSGSPGGMGAPAQPGDATWLHRFYAPASPTPWATPGGDFVQLVSASVDVEGVGTYTFGPAQGMTADVQAWLDDPSANFGWILIGSERLDGTANRFDSRQHPTPSVRPRLLVDYDPPGAPTRTATPSPTATPTRTPTPTSTPTATPRTLSDSSGSPPAALLLALLLGLAALLRVVRPGA